VLYLPPFRVCCDLPSKLTSVGTKAKVVPFGVVSCVRYSCYRFCGDSGYRYLASTIIDKEIRQPKELRRHSLQRISSGKGIFAVHEMHIFQYLKDWLRSSETSSNNDAIESPASSFVSLSHPPEQDDWEVETLVTNLLRLHAQLSSKSDLRPCESINELFGQLVGLCTRVVSESVANKVSNCLRSQNHGTANQEQVMGKPQLLSILPSLRHICAEAEGYLESHWADVISRGENESQNEDAGTSLSSSTNP
jgi:hypothetical protein